MTTVFPKHEGSRGHVKHGHAFRGKRSPEFSCWANMVRRCTNPNIPNWRIYGGRGIAVCARWRKFENFLADMGLKPTPGHSIERRNTNLGYFKENCCWATTTEQANNRRSNRIVEFRGKKQTLSMWGKDVGINTKTIIGRLNLGWGIEKTLTTPVATPNHKKRHA